MTILEMLVRAEHTLRPLLSSLPPKLATRMFSVGRTVMSNRYVNQRPHPQLINASPVTAWGLTFALPLWNAAGMFKNGYGYEVVQRQGAGAFVAGTTTSRPRSGNTRSGVRWPSAVYPHSSSASNWMGLPNDGHAAVAARLANIQRVPGCPIGASVSAEPGLDEEVALAELITGLQAYEAAGVDFIELNESCPNVEQQGSGPVLDEGLLQRLHTIQEQFLAKRTRPLPVVVKFSVDTQPEQLQELLTTLIDLRFDGVILGNTSIRYEHHRAAIASKDQPLYDHFTQTFGGGLSGAIIRADALALASAAAAFVRTKAPSHEFHVIRCGGVSTAEDLRASQEAGILLNQWYTGYFEAFATRGHSLYHAMALGLE